MLRKQVWWVLHRRNIASDFERLVQGLWALRLQVHIAWLNKFVGEDDEGVQQLCSSQHSQPHDEEDDLSQRSGDLEPPRWKDTLVLLYFALVLLRSPATIRDILEWTSDEHFAYRNVERVIPREALRRLPLNWRRRLYNRVRKIPIKIHYYITDT